MQNFLFLKSGRKYSKICFSDIYYIEAVKRYAKIVTCSKTYLMLLPLGRMVQHLPDEMFCRIHKSYIISLAHLSDFENEAARVAGHELPIGSCYRNSLLDKITIVSGEQCSSRGMTERDFDTMLRNFRPN